jgi:hypothetical protein
MRGVYGRSVWEECMGGVYGNACCTFIGDWWFVFASKLPCMSYVITLMYVNASHIVFRSNLSSWWCRGSNGYMTVGGQDGVQVQRVSDSSE